MSSRGACRARVRKEKMLLARMLERRSMPMQTHTQGILTAQRIRRRILGHHPLLTQETPHQPTATTHQVRRRISSRDLPCTDCPFTDSSSSPSETIPLARHGPPARICCTMTGVVLFELNSGLGQDRRRVVLEMSSSGSVLAPLPLFPHHLQLCIGADQHDLWNC